MTLATYTRIKNQSKIIHKIFCKVVRQAKIKLYFISFLWNHIGIISMHQTSRRFEKLFLFLSWKKCMYFSYSSSSSFSIYC